MIPVQELSNCGACVPGLERVPGWERLSWLRAGFSTRQGGFSTAYRQTESVVEGEQNLGWTAEDDHEIVDQARERFAETVAGGETLELVTTRQVHSAVVSVIEPDHGPLRIAPRRSAYEGDGLLTGVPGLLLGVITADCVPVLVADRRTHAVAAFHAGWRGTRARIVEHGIATMRQRFGSHPEDLIAAVGPSIGACCFAVGEEVVSAFESEFDYASELFSEVLVGGIHLQSGINLKPADSESSSERRQTHLDLHAANRRQLMDAGLAAEAIEVVRECTACTRLPDGRRKYFSHRAEQGVTGRMLSAIGAVE